MHHPRSYRLASRQIMPLLLLMLLVMAGAPDAAVAQASPFMTGATALQTNARVAREYLVALPVELTPDQRVGLVRGFSQELSDRYGFAVDVAIHAPRDFPGSDPRNYHAHLLATTREVNAEGLGAKTTLDMNDGDRRKLGLEPAVHELLHVRARWAAVTNEALQEAQVAARIDHRSLEAQGIDREPTPRIPRAAFEMERHGYRSVVAERMRENYQARVQARLEKGASREAAGAEPGIVEPSNEGSGKSRTLGDIQQESVENWLRFRRGQNTGDTQRESVENWLRHKDSPGQKHDQAEPAPSIKTGHARDDDLSL